MARERNHPNPSRPSDAIKTLQIALDNPRLQYRRRYVPADIADLRLSFSGDDAFANAVLAVAREITVALRDPAKYGEELSGKLRRLRRGAFAPLGSKAACLRLAIEPLKDGGLRIYAFRHRHQPPRGVILSGSIGFITRRLPE